MKRRAITKKRKLKGGNGSRRSRSRDRELTFQHYIDEVTDTYWKEYLAGLPKTKESHDLGPDYDSGKGIKGFIRWFRGIPHPDEIEKDLDAQKRFFLNKLKNDKNRWPEVIKLAKENQSTAEMRRRSSANTTRKTQAKVPNYRNPGMWGPGP
jgi:hypothetical protein